MHHTSKHSQYFYTASSASVSSSISYTLKPLNCLLPHLSRALLLQQWFGCEELRTHLVSQSFSLPLCLGKRMINTFQKLQCSSSLLFLQGWRSSPPRRVLVEKQGTFFCNMYYPCSEKAFNWDAKHLSLFTLPHKFAKRLQLSQQKCIPAGS